MMQAIWPKEYPLGRSAPGAATNLADPNLRAVICNATRLGTSLDRVTQMSNPASDILD
jgi:hypothetical protein